MKKNVLTTSFFFFATLILFSSSPVFAADYFHILIYHRFGDQRYPSTNIPLEDFSQQMSYLHDHGYRVIAAGEAIRLLREQGAIPEKTVVLTVDDAYQTFKSGALPVLKRYGFPVTLFVNTDSVGAEGYLNWDELRQMSQDGVEIGNHTATHRSLAQPFSGESEGAYRQRLRADIDRAQQVLIHELGIKPQLFAYPYGEYSRASIDIVREYGFLGAFAQYSGVVGEHDPLYSLPRIPLTGSYATLKQLKDKLQFRPMPVTIVAPTDTLVDSENPPLLVIDLIDHRITPENLRLFVNGQPGGVVERDKENTRRLFIRASRPLQNGRSQYVLTAKGREAGTFYSLTQFWLKRPRP